MNSLMFDYYRFVCPTEIIAFGDRLPEFLAINTEVIAASCDSLYSHLAWVNTPRSEGGLGSMKIPIGAINMLDDMCMLYLVAITHSQQSETNLPRTELTNDQNLSAILCKISSLIRPFIFISQWLTLIRK